MSLWGVTPILTVALLGAGTGTHPALAQAAVHQSVVPSVSAAPVPALSMTAAILKQVPGNEWQTTVLVDDIAGGCPAGSPGDDDYLLETTGPEKALTPISVTSVIRSGERGGTEPAVLAVATDPAASSCEVTLDFAGLQQVPSTATLVLDGSSSISLTVSRNVTLFYYLGIPAIVGGAMTILLLVLSLLIHVYGWDRNELHRFRRKWLQHPVLGSGAWALNDSWATNISTGLVVVGTVLATTSAANSLFPGVALDRFAIVNIVAAAIVVAAPVVFGIYYAVFTAGNPGPTADATVRVPEGAAARIKVPSGASITMFGDAIRDEAGNEETIKSGSTYQVPPGATVSILRGAMAVPGTSDIGVRPGSLLGIDVFGDAWPILQVEPDAVVSRYQTFIDAAGGAKITVTGTADITFLPGTVITAPFRDERPLTKEKRLQAPQGTNVLVATMGMLVFANVFTMFGIGAELGIAGVLAYFSEATQPWRVVMFCAIAAVTALVLLYAKTATRAMADPQPGSSLSSQAGTSFTL
ncbi:MAG: hypothetical protein ACRDOA_02260 [Streptosporangiaceae bacterium]